MNDNKTIGIIGSGMDKLIRNEMIKKIAEDMTIGTVIQTDPCKRCDGEDMDCVKCRQTKEHKA